MEWQGLRYNGQVTDWRFRAEDGVFPDAQTASRIADLAAALGVAPSAVEAFESETEPVATVTVPPKRPAVDAALNALTTVLAKPDADVTAAEIKALVLGIGRRLRNRRAL